MALFDLISRKTIQKLSTYGVPASFSARFGDIVENCHFHSFQNSKSVSL